MGKKYNETYTMECTEVKKDTGVAILCATKEHGDVWIPKSQIHDDSETYKAGTNGTLIVKQWLAEERGWV